VSHFLPCYARGGRRGREGSYPPSPRTNPDVRNYHIGLFRDTRFRMITCSATHCLFPAVRFAQFTSPACLACVSSTSCVSLSTPFPCERRYRLRVLRRPGARANEGDYLPTGHCEAVKAAHNDTGGQAVTIEERQAPPWLGTGPTCRAGWAQAQSVMAPTVPRSR